LFAIRDSSFDLRVLDDVSFGRSNARWLAAGAGCHWCQRAISRNARGFDQEFRENHGLNWTFGVFFNVIPHDRALGFVNPTNSGGTDEVL